MTTAAALIAQTRADQLHEHPSLNVLDGAITDSATNVTMLRELGTLAPGSRLSVDLEDMHVWETSGQTVGVLRAADGTTAAAHSDQAVVLVDPRFSNAQILRAVNQELASLGGEGLWRARTVDLETEAVERSYNLTGVTDLIGLHEVRVDDTDPSNQWPTVPAYVDRSASTTDFASGLALMLRMDVEPGRTMRVTYRSNFTALATLADDVETVSGLWSQAHDILQIGAAARLLAGTEVARSRMSAQGDIRRAGEVPPGANLQASRGLLALRERRISEEKRRLRALYPIPVGVR